MKRLASIVLVPCLMAIGLGPFAAAPVAAQQIGQGAAPHVKTYKAPSARIRIRPLYPYRHTNTPYPPVNEIDYPGPNAYRDCVDRLVVEHRPSGTVIVPRMRCRWVRG